jgi:hypothetical protein
VLINCVELTYPADPKPAVVLTSCAVEIYPEDPRPIVVEARPEVLRNPAVARPTTVLVSSVGSIMLLILEFNPETVDIRVADEI